MTTAEERMRILKMIEEGRIGAEEAGRLLAALDKASGAQTGAAGAAETPRRFLRIRVTDAATGQQRVNVNVPIILLDTVIRFVPNGIKTHLQSLQQAMNAGISGRIVDVMDEEGGRVEIFIE